MQHPPPKLIAYLASSLDGYLAEKDGNLDFLKIVEKKGEDYGYQSFMNTIDTVVMGRKTYEKVCQMGVPNPHPHQKTYIITRQNIENNPQHPNIFFYNKNLPALIQNLKNRSTQKNIFIDGGAEILNQLFKLNLINELYISIIPILLGGGIPLFQSNIFDTPQKLTLISNQTFETGLVQLHYHLQKP